MVCAPATTCSSTTASGWPSASCTGTRSTGSSRSRVRTGAGATDEQFRLWFVDHATHIPVSMLAPTERARLLDVQGCTQQAVCDLIAWVEDGVAPPASTAYSVDDDCAVRLAGAPAERRGIQPVVTARANGA